jgi:hypothetical protein
VAEKKEDVLPKNGGKSVLAWRKRRKTPPLCSTTQGTNARDNSKRYLSSVFQFFFSSSSSSFKKVPPTEREAHNNNKNKNKKKKQRIEKREKQRLPLRPRHDCTGGR